VGALHNPATTSGLGARCSRRRGNRVQDTQHQLAAIMGMPPSPTAADPAPLTHPLRGRAAGVTQARCHAAFASLAVMCLLSSHLACLRNRRFLDAMCSTHTRARFDQHGPHTPTPTKLLDHTMDDAVPHSHPRGSSDNHLQRPSQPSLPGASDSPPSARYPAWAPAAASPLPVAADRAPAERVGWEAAAASISKLPVSPWPCLGLSRTALAARKQAMLLAESAVPKGSLSSPIPVPSNPSQTAAAAAPRMPDEPGAACNCWNTGKRRGPTLEGSAACRR
jgi:hypothetical protein